MSTVHICLQDILGVAVSCEVIFYPGDTPFQNGAALAVSGVRSIRLDAEGEGTVSLVPGRYAVRFSGITSNTDTLIILVPDDEAIHELPELICGGNWVLPMRDFLQKSQNLADIADPMEAFSAIKQAATEEASGVVALATQAEVEAGTEAAKAVTPVTLAGALSSKAPAMDLIAHVNNTSNPHGVTKAQVGLGNVDNTSDASKPVSAAVQAALNTKADATALTSHTANTANPHSVTKAQVGLGNVDNTSDASKPVSTAVQAALNTKADATALTSHTANTANPHSVTKAQVGLDNVDNTSDDSKPVSTAVQAALNTKADATALTSHTANTANPHSVTKAQVGLGNVDNTSDASKPVSMAQQTAIDLKFDKAGGTVTGNIVGNGTANRFPNQQAATIDALMTRGLTSWQDFISDSYIRRFPMNSAILSSANGGAAAVDVTAGGYIQLSTGTSANGTGWAKLGRNAFWAGTSTGTGVKWGGNSLGFIVTVFANGFDANNTIAIQFGRAASSPSPAIATTSDYAIGLQLYAGSSTAVKLYAANGTAVNYSAAVTGLPWALFVYTFIVWSDGAGNVYLYQAQTGSRPTLLTQITGGPTVANSSAQNSLLEAFSINGGTAPSTSSTLQVHSAAVALGLTPSN